MRIETKFQPGQEVWFMCDNKPQTGFIKEVVFIANCNNTILKYGVNWEHSGKVETEVYYENDLACNKDELRDLIFH